MHKGRLGEHRYNQVYNTFTTVHQSFERCVTIEIIVGEKALPNIIPLTSGDLMTRNRLWVAIESGKGMKMKVCLQWSVTCSETTDIKRESHRDMFALKLHVQRNLMTNIKELPSSSRASTQV